MRSSSLSAFLLLLLFHSVSGEAQVAVRTWVSGNGVDSALCDRNNPCRTFGAAITAVGAGGEVVVLDSGGYGPVTIDKAVSIVSPPGVFAAIAPTAGSAITIAPGVTGIMVLRGLTLNSRGAVYGINDADEDGLGGNRLFIEDCRISGFSDTGIRLLRPLQYVIRNTMVRESGTGVFSGSPACTGTDGILDGVGLESNSVGLNVTCGRVAVRNSVASLNLVDGFEVGNGGVVIIEDSKATHNLRGILVRNAGHLRLFNSVIVFNNLGLGLGGLAILGGNTVTDNVRGILNEGGETLTRGDNTIERNSAANVAGVVPLTPYTTR